MLEEQITNDVFIPSRFLNLAFVAERALAHPRRVYNKVQ